MSVKSVPKDKAEQHINNLIEMYHDIKTTYEYNLKNLTDLDMELQDLQHEIELSTFTASAGYKLAKELKKVRQERRKVKDENDTMKFLYDYLIVNANYKTMPNDFNRVRNEIKKENEKKNNRFYIPRIRTDMTINTKEKVTDIGRKLKKVINN